MPPKKDKKGNKQKKEPVKEDTSKSNQILKQEEPVQQEELVKEEEVKEPIEDQNTSYKIIVAIKTVKEHSNNKQPNIKCTIGIQNKSKAVILPFTEGQFFDLNNLSIGDEIQLNFTIANTQSPIGNINIPISENIMNNGETELAEEFSFPYNFDGIEFKFVGSYYIIVLNKTVFLEQSPQRESTKKSSRRNVSFQPEQEKSSTKQSPSKVKRQQTGGSPLKKQKQEDPQEKEFLQNLIENSVKNAIKELKASQKLEASELNYEQKQDTMKRAQTIERLEDSPTRLSESVQIIRQSTKNVQNRNDSFEEQRLSPTRLATFNIDDDPPQRSSKGGKSSPTRHTDHYDHHCHENLTCLYYIDQANQSEDLKIKNDYLKKVIYLMEKKQRAAGISEQYNQRFQDEIEQTEEARKNLENKLLEHQKETQKLKDQIQKQLGDALNEKQQVMQECIKLTEENERLKQQNKGLSNELQQQKLKNSDLITQLNDQKKLNQRHKQTEEKLAQAEKREVDSIIQYKEKLQQLDELLDQQNRQKRSHEQKMNELQNELLEAQNKIGQLDSEIDDLKNEISKLSKTNNYLKQRENTQKILNDQITSLQNEVNEKLKAKQQADILNEQLRKQIQALNNQLVEKDKANNEKIKEFRKQIQQAHQAEQQANEQVADKNKQIALLKGELKSAQLGLVMLQDTQKQLEEEKNKVAHYHKNQQVLNNQVSELGALNQQSNKQILEINNRNLELQDEVDTQKKYSQNLKQLIVEMQEKNIVYMPIHTDPIDKALADFINSFYDPLKLSGLFIRESEGVYQFGTKKLYIKIEQNKILIRIGGGFIGIDEFLDLYTPAELEKMKRLSPQNIKKKNDDITDNMDKNMKVIREFKHPQKVPIKVKSVGAVFAEQLLDDK